MPIAHVAFLHYGFWWTTSSLVSKILSYGLVKLQQYICHMVLQSFFMFLLENINIKINCKEKACSVAFCFFMTTMYFP